MIQAANSRQPAAGRPQSRKWRSICTARKSVPAQERPGRPGNDPRPVGRHHHEEETTCYTQSEGTTFTATTPSHSEAPPRRLSCPLHRPPDTPTRFAHSPTAPVGEGTATAPPRIAPSSYLPSTSPTPPPAAQSPRPQVLTCTSMSLSLSPPAQGTNRESNATRADEQWRKDLDALLEGRMGIRPARRLRYARVGLHGVRSGNQGVACSGLPPVSTPCPRLLRPTAASRHPKVVSGGRPM